jgi:hypothetical protein
MAYEAMFTTAAIKEDGESDKHNCTAACRALPTTDSYHFQLHSNLSRSDMHLQGCEFVIVVPVVASMHGSVTSKNLQHP